MGEDRVEGVRSPTVQRHILLESLIGHRKRLGITQQEVAAELDVSVQTVMRLEAGQVQLKRDYLSCMTRFYRLTESESERLNALRWGAREPEWWKPYASVLSTDEQQRLGWRSGAQAIQEWACLTVPELLQTRDYATAALLEEPPARRELLVEARLQAQIQSTFTRVRQRYVLDEAVVWRR
uniref:Scr1 family TA system antitoxin-like transcriptional regulator n=1 Tax=Nocardiopsis synnemataformans TaxID=61305 RepID=UPI003EC0F951